MKPNGKGVAGYRPYRRFSSKEVLAASSYDLDRAIKRRAEENAERRRSEPHLVSAPSWCRNCGGTGYREDNRTVCPACKGLGGNV